MGKDLFAVNILEVDVLYVKHKRSSMVQSWTAPYQVTLAVEAHVINGDSTEEKRKYGVFHLQAQLFTSLLFHMD